MKKNFAETLREMRQSAGFTQKQAYEKIGVPQSTFSSWEIGKSEPSADILLRLCEIYGVTDILSAFGYDGYNDDGSILLDIKEQGLIEKYRSLDAYGRETISISLDREAERVKTITEQSEQLKQQADRIAELEPMLAQSAIVIRLYAYLNKIASAGSGFYFDDIPTDTIEAPYCKGADFIIGVNGDSMEPDYHDGDKLYIQKAKALSIGDVGIFTVWNECFVKELGERGLISKNPAYDDIPGTEDVRLIGRVLGKVEID